MITHCKTSFQDNTYTFDKYPFELSNFQKWAIKATNENKNVLGGNLIAYFQF